MEREAAANMSQMSAQELKLVIDFFRTGLDLNKRHAERLRDLRIGD
jgi:hypothetical protein